MGKRKRRKDVILHKKAPKSMGSVSPYIQALNTSMRSAEAGKAVPLTNVATIGAAVPRRAVMDELVERMQTEGLSASQIFVRLWKGTRRQGLEIFHYQRQFHPTWNWLRIFFSGNDYFFLREDTGSVSITYQGRDRMQQAFIRKIIWIDHIELRSG